jgi:protein-disulfide isomerase
MRCEEVRENIADYLAKTSREPLDSRVAEHLKHCPQCSDELEEVTYMWADLGEIPVPRLDPSRARAAILAAVAHESPAANRFRHWRFDVREVLKAGAVIVALTTLATGAGLYLSRREVSAPSSPSPTVVAKADAGHVRGPSSAPITLEEYGDYECQSCGSQDMVRRLLQKYPDTIKYEYHHFPLTKIHANAMPAAIAAEAAGDQGKFWEMHDLLLSSRAKWSHSPQPKQHFLDMAIHLGLKPDKFTRSVEASSTEATILRDMTKASELGIQGVPTFFMDGTKLEIGPDPFQQLDHLIADRLKMLHIR